METHFRLTLNDDQIGAVEKATGVRLQSDALVLVSVDTTGAEGSAHLLIMSPEFDLEKLVELLEGTKRTVKFGVTNHDPN